MCYRIAVRAHVTVAVGLAALFAGATLFAAGGDHRLADAVKNRDASEIGRLLQEHVDINVPQPDGATALHWAAHWDDHATAALLIEAGAKVDATNELGITPMHLACTNGSFRMVNALLAAKANPNLATPSGEAPLMTAARSGNSSVVTALVGAGADVNAKESTKGQTALMWAFAQGHIDAAEVLLNNGADVKAKATSGYTPLLFAVRAGDPDGTKLALLRGAYVNETAADGTTPLLLAVVRGHANLAEFLLSHGADPNASGAGFTPLHWAAGRWETLLSEGSGAGVSEDLSRMAGLPTPRKIQLIKSLLSHGADPNARAAKSPPRFGFTLGLLVYMGGLRLAGATPFLMAAMVADVDVMRVLLAAGADPKMATNDQTTPLMVAAGFGRVTAETRVPESRALEAVKMVVEAGNDVNAANARGYTAMHAAAYIGADSVARFLIEKGADVNAKDKSGTTPTFIAAQVDPLHLSTAEVLRKAGGIEAGSTNADQ